MSLTFFALAYVLSQTASVRLHGRVSPWLLNARSEPGFDYLMNIAIELRRAIGKIEFVDSSDEEIADAAKSWVNMHVRK